MTIEISAILITHNRANLLEQVLIGLKKQTLDRSRYEIIIVDDGSIDETSKVLSEWKDKLALRIFYQNQSGLAAAKNLGIFAASGEIIVFLDDDDVADENMLLYHLACHIRNPSEEVAVLGFTKLASHINEVPLMYYVTSVGHQLFSYSFMEADADLTYKDFWGGA